jgi:integrative and conjugative element protein (TIGR02256 family)
MTRRPVRVTVAATAADLIAKRARKAAPNETGGLLLGWWEGTAVVVAHAVEVPDPDATSSRWTRHENTAQAALDAALSDPSHPWLGYVGDWHSHPAPVDPSTTDELSLRHASRQYPQPLALLVHQPDGHLDLHVAHQGRSRAARLDLTAAAPVSETTTTCEHPGERDAHSDKRRIQQRQTDSR